MYGSAVFMVRSFVRDAPERHSVATCEPRFGVIAPGRRKETPCLIECLRLLDEIARRRLSLTQIAQKVEGSRFLPRREAQKSLSEKQLIARVLGRGLTGLFQESDSLQMVDPAGDGK